LRAVAVDFDLELEEDVEEAKNNEDVGGEVSVLL
jgi:hypothetical protein